MNENFFHIDDDVLVKYLLGESSADENIAVVQWINAAASNKKYYEDFELIWMQSKQIAAASNVDENKAWQRFQQRIHAAETTRGKVRKMSFYSLMKVAAMIILIAGGVTLGFIIFGKKEIPTLAVQSNNNVISDTLSDGSVVTLNKNSSLSYPEKFNKSNRTVALKGEAFFSVTPDKKKPFIIHVNDITVRVVGTLFNIKNTNGNTEVIVKTGIVEVIRKNKKIDLHPQEKVVIKNTDTAMVKQTETGNLYNYYRTKEFECDNTPLWKLAEVLSEAYDTTIVIERNELRNLPLTTTFNNQSLDHILEIIGQTFTISVNRSGNKIILK